jgi:cytidyltransferase-like protein
LPQELAYGDESKTITLSLSPELSQKLQALRPLSYVCVASDFLHHGHVHIINEARKLGTTIVGILTDAAVESYKGKPAVPFEQRKFIFENIKGVHCVVAQHSLSYTANLRLLKPEFVVHGDNWRNDEQSVVRKAVLAELALFNGQLIEPEFTKLQSLESPIQALTDGKCEGKSDASPPSLPVSPSRSTSSAISTPIRGKSPNSCVDVDQQIQTRCFASVELLNKRKEQQTKDFKPEAAIVN